MKIIKELGMKLPNEGAKRKRRYVLCECSYCGVEKELRKDHLNTVKSCGCQINVLNSERSKDRVDSLIGKKFDRLTVLEFIREEKHSNEYVKIVNAECDCKNIIEVNLRSITRGHTKSCGCLQREKASDNMRIVGESNIKHGMEGTKIYKVLDGMKQRCGNPNRKSYKYYGEKGITVCDEWINDFMTFYNWAIENGYKEGLTIDRINPNKGYNPENCEWVTKSENTRRMHITKRKDDYFEE